MLPVEGSPYIHIYSTYRYLHTIFIYIYKYKYIYYLNVYIYRCVRVDVSCKKGPILGRFQFTDVIRSQ